MQTLYFVLLWCISCYAIHQKPKTHRQEGMRITRDGLASPQCDLNEFEVIGKPYMTRKGTKKQKAQQYCNDIPIYGACIVIESNEDGSNPVPCSGLFYKCNEIELDLSTSGNKINSGQAIQSVISPQNKSTISSSTANLYIYFDQMDGQQYLSWIIRVSGNDYSWFAIVDANLGNILMKIDTMKRVTVHEVGGNERFGPINHEFDVPSYPELRNSRIIIKNDKSQEIIQCTSTTDCVNDEVNGGFGPAGDAFKFGNDVFDLYEDWAFGLTPVKPELIPVAIHVDGNVALAHWNGVRVSLSNGNEQVYPVTLLDVIAHELSHGFTDMGSDLIYLSESGGINEAYSDLAGEAAKSYVRNYNTWRLAFSLHKIGTSRTARRYMYDPPIDNSSVDQWSPDVGNLNVHLSSGVYNKFFYLLYSYGWSTKRIFQIASKANEIYWGPFETMNTGACGIIDAAIDLFGENESMQNDIKQAFKTVNVACSGPFIVVEHQQGLSANNSQISGQYNNTNNMSLQMAITGEPSGEADLYVKFGEPPTLEVFDCRPYLVGNNEICAFSISQIGIYHWMINPYEAFSGVTFSIRKEVSKPSFDEFEECNFEPLDIEDVNVWSSTIYNNGHPWLITRNVDKLWISSYELSKRSINILLSKFCSVSEPRYLSVTGRASGLEPKCGDTYRLLVEFKNVGGHIVNTFDTGFVKTKHYFKEYIASYDNSDGHVTSITITEWGDDAENDVTGYFGVALKLPIIHISNRKDPDVSKCFIGSHCKSTSACCPNDVDDRGIGVECVNRRCCVKDGYFGCLRHNHCCGRKSFCFDGVCGCKSDRK